MAMDSRCDLCLHKDEDEDKQSRKDAGKHHPDGELTIRAQRIDDPTSLIRTSHGKTSGYTQFLQKDNTYGNKKIWEKKSNKIQEKEN